jgi:type II secretion system protein D
VTPSSHALRHRLALVTALTLATFAHAQDDRSPERDGPAPPKAPTRAATGSGKGDAITDTRRVLDDELVPLNFEDKTVQDFIPIIVEYTGKAVMTRSQLSPTTKVSIRSDRMVTKHEALNLIFQAFRLNSIGVVETPDMIMIDALSPTNMSNFQPGLILGPDADVTTMAEEGQIVTKVFRLTHAKAADILDQIEDVKPEYARVSSDVNSNQLICEGDLAWVKRVQRLLDLLDVEPFLDVKTETFRLAYADAQTIADIVLELFSPSPNAGGSRTSRTTAVRGRPTPQQGNQEVPQVGISEQLQVSVLPQTNSVTVRAEPQILEDISFLIETAWDVPPSREGDVFRLYDLRYTDPVKVKNLLTALLETGGGGGGRPAGRTQGGGAPTGADAAVADIFRIEAYPDSNRLVVISKTPDNFDWLDGMIAQIDQPLSVGLPVNVELKYASAIDVADILNTLLAQAGGGGRGIRLPEEGLSGIDFSSAGGGEGATGTQQESEEITFPWQSGRGANGDEAAEVSALVGKSRVVPNPGQNSLLVLATPEIQDALLSIIEDLDRPGRQVMITATLAEVTLGDGLNLGIRVGSNISAQGDNSIGGRVGLNLTKGNTNGTDGDQFASPWFDTSFLEVNTDVNFIISALSETNNVRILQRPRVFTSDNREAKFFAGQDVTFQTGSTTNQNGTTSNFDQQSIGIGLNVRPRITKERNVAMEIEVLLSNLAQTQFINDNPVVNRRQTTTTVTVKNNQTIVISGIRREDDSDIVRKVPLLGDIPGLGAIFSSTEKSKALVELVIFVTPIVVDNPDENDANFNENDLKRLDELSKPLEEMSSDLTKGAFFDAMEDTDSKTDDTTKTSDDQTEG